MKTNVKEIIWVNNPTYVIGNFKVVILEPVSVETNTALRSLLDTALMVRGGDKKATLSFFADFCVLQMLLPVRVLPVLHSFVD